MSDRPLRIGVLGAARITPMALIRPAREVPEVEVTAESTPGSVANCQMIQAGKMAMEFSNISVGPLFEKVVSIFRTPAEEKGVSLSFYSPEEIPNVKADSDKIVWVIWG